ncbi:MAG TPA: hypothetical protein VFV87_03380 [Pirellulaceae bacterium]|nr:hypothetical protein [Pirellulaceae bacterium]
MLTLWAAAVAAGFWGLWTYASTPGRAERAPATWPQDSQLARSPGRWTLVVFIHPRCPCTSASLTELEKLQAHLLEDIDIHIVSIQPRIGAEDWPDTPLVRRAAAIPGAIIGVDVDGHEARRFHARTSGETLLFDPHGRLAFHGGITASRGHEGDNPGSDAILALVAGQSSAAPLACPAFGCPLRSDRDLASSE